jgi:hypothetical protein
MDNAAYTQETAFSVPQIIAGGTYTTRKLTLVSGAGDLDAGTVLGAILAAAAATVTVGTPVSGVGGTVGNGTVSAFTSDDGAQEGTWMLICTATGATGKFRVMRPDGTLDGILTIGSAYNGGINGTVSDGANDWLVDDVIPITVAYTWASLKYKKSIAAATDGSQYPRTVLAQDTDATSADKEAICFETGQLIGSGLTLGAGHTVATIRERMRALGLVIDD